MMRMLGAFAGSVVLGMVVLHGQSATPGQASGQGQQTVQPGQTTAPQRMPARPLRPGETPPKGTAVLKGQVLTSGTGTPVRRAQVRAMSMEGRGGGVANTDAEGRYELKELPAGRYTITANKGGYVMGQYGQRRPGEPGTPVELSDGQTADKVNFVLSRGSVISGRIVDDGGEPVSGTNVQAMRYQFMAGSRRLMPGGGEGSSDRTDDQGQFRLYGLAPGDYYISANNRSTQFMGPGVVNNEADGFAPTYYPGTPSISEAQRVTVKAGQEMTGANFALFIARMARIRGRALSSNGQPLTTGMLMLQPSDPTMGFGGMNMMNAMLAGDGTFQFANVAPGRYQLSVRPNGMATASSEMATLPVVVSNDDIDNLIITTSTGAVARGVIVTEDGSVPTFKPDQVSIFPGTMDPVGGVMMFPGQNRVNDDFTFELTGLSDRRLIRAGVGQGMSTGWWVKAVLHDGEDITDSGMEFTPGRTYEGLQIILTQKATDLSGLLTDDRNRPVLDATVVIFPADPQRWTFSSRYMRSLRPDTNGRFSTKGLPPLDDYMIIAVQGLESGQGTDPEFLARAKEEAKPLTLNEGETKTFDLKLSKLAP
jgi:hypothetical protein